MAYPAPAWFHTLTDERFSGEKIVFGLRCCLTSWFMDMKNFLKRFVGVSAMVVLISGFNDSGIVGRSMEAGLNDGYTLVFQDEFDYVGEPDARRWNFETGFIRNNEPQWYQKENARVDNGVLTITTRKEHVKNPNYDARSSDWRLNTPAAEYTSASVISKGKFEFKFGRVEARLKINATQGQWPAFWMLGSNRGPVAWPACGEVDIMEYYRGIMHANLAWQAKGGHSEWHTEKHSIADIGDKAFWNEFHIWRLDWDEEFMRIYMDDHLMNETRILDIRNGERGNNPFHEKFYLVMNAALGQGGEAIPEHTLPSTYLIDYVRVYQKL